MSGLSAELKQVFKEHGDKARPVKQAAVLGAGIMGGGITITSAAHGVPVIMKDIAQEQLDLGMKTATSQVNRLVKKEQMTQEQANQVLATIEPTLEYEGLTRLMASSKRWWKTSASSTRYWTSWKRWFVRTP